MGETEEKETGENIGQGTLEGATISAANIDYTVNMFFKSSLNEEWGKAPATTFPRRYQPLLNQCQGGPDWKYKDGICNGNKTVGS